MIKITTCQHAVDLRFNDCKLCEPAPPKPADVAKVRRYTAGDIFRAVEAGLHSDTEFCAALEADTLLLERDALAADNVSNIIKGAKQAEEIESLQAELALRNTLYDQSQLAIVAALAELTAERERVKDLRDTLLCLDGNLFCGNQNVSELRSIISSALTTKADTGEQT